MVDRDRICPPDEIVKCRCQGRDVGGDVPVDVRLQPAADQLRLLKDILRSLAAGCLGVVRDRDVEETVEGPLVLRRQLQHKRVVGVIWLRLLGADEDLGACVERLAPFRQGEARNVIELLLLYEENDVGQFPPREAQGLSVKETMRLDASCTRRLRVVGVAFALG